MKKFIGDKAFYKMVLLVAVPIMVQNGITNFVNLLDNIMVGQVGTPRKVGAELSCVGCAPCFFPAICCGMASFTRLSKAS